MLVRIYSLDLVQSHAIGSGARSIRFQWGASMRRTCATLAGFRAPSFLPFHVLATPLTVLVELYTVLKELTSCG